MIDNAVTPKVYRLDLEAPTFDDSYDILKPVMWDVAWVESQDISIAVLFLTSEASRCITGVTVPVDLGMTQECSGS